MGCSVMDGWIDLCMRSWIDVYMDESLDGYANGYVG